MTSPIVPLVLSLAALGFAYEGFKELKHRRGEAAAEPQKAEAIVSKSGTSIGTGGAATARIGDIHFHPPVLPLPAPPSPPRQKIVKVEHSEPVMKAVFLDDAGSTLCIGERRDSWRALVVPIYLDAEKSDAGVHMDYVRATLVFTRPDSKKVVRISHGAWIKPNLDYVEMSPGELKHLVAVVFKGDLSGAAAINSNVTEYGFYSNNQDAFEFEDLGLEKYGVRIIVMWAGATRGKEIFDLTLDLKQIAESAA